MEIQFLHVPNSRKDTKHVAKFHTKGSFLHSLINELNASLRIFDEVFGHPIDIHLGDEDV